MEHTHRANSSFEPIEQPDGQTDKSTYKEVLKKTSEPVKEPVMKLKKKYFKCMDSDNQKNICAEGLNNLTKEISF